MSKEMVNKGFFSRKGRPSNFKNMKHKDNVLFFLDKEGDVFAYFPNLFDLNGNKTSYAHIGQHSACSPEYVKECKQATPEQYSDLAKELTSLGYTLNIL